MKREIEIILPEFKKGQYVEYRAYNPNSEKLERFRIYKGFALLKNDEEREAYADKLIKSYSAKLRAGWRPWANENIIYKDEFTYNTEVQNFGSQRKDSFHVRRYASLYFHELKDRKLAKKTEQTYQSKLRMFLLWLDKNGLNKCRPGEISNEIIKQFFSYLIQLNLDQVTITNYRLLLVKFFDFCKTILC